MRKIGKQITAIIMALAVMLSMASLSVSAKSDTKEIFKGEYVTDVIQNESETITLVDTSSGFYYTTDGMNFTKVDVSAYIPKDGSDERVSVYNVDDTFYISISTFETSEYYDEEWDEWRYKETPAAHTLIATNDFKSFKQYTAPNDCIGDILKLNNGTYILQAGYYTEYWGSGRSSYKDLGYYYTTKDFKTYKKYYVPETDYNIVTYRAIGDTLIVEYNDFLAFGDGQPTEIVKIYMTTDFNSYTDITPSSNKSVILSAIGGYTPDIQEKNLYVVSSAEYYDEKAQRYCYTCKLSLINLETGKESVLVNKEDYDGYWAYVALDNNFVFFLDKTYIYNTAEKTLKEGYCAYKDYCGTDSDIRYDKDHTIGVKGADNRITIINPNRLDQCKTIDVSEYGFAADDEIYYDPCYYLYTMNGEIFMLAAFGENNKVSKLNLDLSWDNTQPDDKKAVKSVKVDDVTINYKKSAALKPQITSDQGVKYTVKYESSNPKAATVDKDGNVYGAKKGTADIEVTVTDENGNTVTDTCKVTVKYTFGQWLIKILLFGWIWY